MTVVDDYLINDVPLGTAAVQLETAEGLQEAPELRDLDIDVPSMHGQLDIGSDETSQRRSYGPGLITFAGWVKGIDPDTGIWAGDDLDLYFARVDDLLRMFHARNLQIDHLRPDGTRRATGHLVGGLAITREPSSPWFGRWKAIVKIPAVFWSALDDVTASGTVATGGTIDLSGFAGGVAPIADGELLFGPSSNPTWTHGGAYFRYGGVISSGRELSVDCATGQLGVGGGAAWTPDEAAVEWNPGPAYFELDPTGPSHATFTHTGGGTAFAQFTGKPKHLTS